MNQHLKIKLGRSDGALVRLLGHTERRGFALVGVSAIPTGPMTQLVDLKIQAIRPIEHLIHQLYKLYDVQHVEKAQ